MIKIDEKEEYNQLHRNDSINRDVQTTESARAGTAVKYHSDAIDEQEIGINGRAYGSFNSDAYAYPKIKQFREIEEAQRRMSIKMLMINKLEKQKVIRHQIQESDNKNIIDL